MTRVRRRPWHGSLWLVAAVGAVSGCEMLVGDLPDPYEPVSTEGSGGEGAESGGATGVESGGATDGGGTWTDEDASGAMGDSGQGGAGNPSGGASSGGASSGGASSGGASSGGTGTECPADADRDGHLSKACGGDDCDDSDGFVFPGQTAYFTGPSKGGSYDYDCDRVITRDPSLNQFVTCGLLQTCPTTSQGYFGADASAIPACGGSADWGTCVKNTLGLSCDPVKAAQVKMACR